MTPQSNSRETRLLREIESLTQTDDVQQLQDGISKLLSAYQKQTRRMEKILSQSDKQQEQLLALNERLEEFNQKIQEAQQQTNEALAEVSALLDNSGEGFLSFGTDMKIHPSYSQECHHMLGPEIAGVSIASLLYPDNPKEQEMFQGVLQSTSIAQHELQKEALLSLLPTEIQLKERWLDCRFRFIHDGRIMLVLTDITEQKELNEKIRREQQRLLLIVNAMKNRNELLEIVDEFEQFNEWAEKQLRQTTGWPDSKQLKDFYRTVHTFKGNFAQIHFHYLPSALHELEEELNQFWAFNDTDKTILTQRYETHLQKCTEALARDIADITDVLGQEFVHPHKSYHISEEELHDVESRLLPMIYSEEAHIEINEDTMRVINLFRQLQFKSIRELLSGYPVYAQELAERLEKEIHPFEVEGGDFKVDPERYRPFCKSLVHLFRNAIDHGIESPDERLETGKDEVATISCTTSYNQRWITIAIADDGQGIDTQKILDKASRLGIICKDDPCRLIFEDGFSTKEEVNALSGRGVGLSAVKAECKKLGGYIDIETSPRRGTTFYFFLPNTEESF